MDNSSSFTYVPLHPQAPLFAGGYPYYQRFPYAISALVLSCGTQWDSLPGLNHSLKFPTQLQVALNF